MTKPLEICLIPEIIDDTTGEQRYPCMIDGCSYTTTNVVGYTNHVKLKHKINPLDYFTKYIAPRAIEKLEHKYRVQGKCVICGEKTEFRSINAGYFKYCSLKCSVNDPEVADKRTVNTKAALLEKYGVENASQINGNSAKVKATKLERYGNENYCNADAAIETNLKKYGKKSFLATAECVAKRIEHAQKTYGADHHMKSVEWKDQMKQIFLEKLGVGHPASQPEVKARIKARALAEGKNYVLRRPSTREARRVAGRAKIAAIVESNMNGVLGEHVTAIDLLAGRFLCNVCRKEFVMPAYGTSRSQPRTYPRCIACFPIKDNKDSIIQQELVAWVTADKDIGGCGLSINDVSLNDRLALGNGKEIDLYIPSKQIGLELNGNFWHTEVFGNKPKTYHQDKVTVAASKGIRLVHIFEDDWLKKRDLVKEKIKQILGVQTPQMKYYARKTSTYAIQTYEGEIPDVIHGFFDANHIQGSVRNLRKDMIFAITATRPDDGEIIAAMLLTKQKRVHMSKKKNNISSEFAHETWELVRYAVMAGCLCVGMAGKLMKQFIDSAKTRTVVTSYADLAWSKHPGVNSENGSMYEKLGFKQIAITQPSYCYVHRSDFLTRQHRYKYRKSELVKLKMMSADDQGSLTEWDVMQKHNFDRIWDCGKIKYELRIEPTVRPTQTSQPDQNNN